MEILYSDLLTEIDEPLCSLDIDGVGEAIGLFCMKNQTCGIVENGVAMMREPAPVWFVQSQVLFAEISIENDRSGKRTTQFLFPMGKDGFDTLLRFGSTSGAD